MMENGIKILTEREAQERLDQNTLEGLVNAWVEDQFKFNPEPESQTRQQIKAWIRGLPMGECFYQGWRTCRNQLREAFPQLSSTKKQEDKQKKEWKAFIRDILIKARNEGNIVVAEEEGEIIGMVKVSKIENPNPHNFHETEIYEIGKAFTLPEHRGKGTYTKLRARAIEHLTKTQAKATIISATKYEHIKKMNKADGWEEIGFERYLKIHGLTDEQIDMERNWFEEDKCTAFMHKPN